MLPHQGYSRPEHPKGHGFNSSIKLSPLQNYGSMNLQNHGISDTMSNLFAPNRRPESANLTSNLSESANCQNVWVFR
jgi:hypothetical protein